MNWYQKALHYFFGHNWTVTWKNMWFEELERVCTWCGKYEHRSTTYTDDPYLTVWHNGQNPYFPNWSSKDRINRPND